ncbi:type-F conjugative transfer system secretin TraK [Burkholderia cenocepacia]|uniref:type-F conjugative transfer system secretin TraK n=1 Tax=Burkholderia cepacia complex TaxID=87882 RepID=UPI00158A7017|nr:type-F conjugative transfer system secretin TraK [Burkholderia cenocepacia]MBJ9671140.1 type-F conjugative transfer system secretin TraK [Burkholderia cenocepacia]MBJ9730750.1 type-F conjugative transfer system secretin TraK [Burkholderia cenocepacia]MCA7967424.1 type-F conjugative transfer system secretin TraK [Burkholderia cenocepacia]MDR8056479.1 type-F conjugative transfer system secretin TraK [Burkholderia cenocepacia]MDR8066918.1 type-F conjugative transfer system secretin TraK [Burkh
MKFAFNRQSLKLSTAFRPRLVFAAVMFLTTASVHAIQVVKGADRQAQQVSISAAEYNVLSMSGGRIFSKIVPAVPNSISWTQDGGKLWLMPANPTALNESITVFVIDDAGTTYRLLLVPGPRPAEDIRIEPPAARSTQAFHASAFQRRVKLMMLAMAGGRGAPQLSYTSVDTIVPLWKEAVLTLVRQYSDGDFIGETYTLSNTSHSDMAIDERELYAPGVLAVAIENANLPAGASTIVYVVRERGDHE